jgi:hypothetical protein
MVAMPPKVMGHMRFGFAPELASRRWLCPVEVALTLLGCALRAASGPTSQGVSPNQGHSPEIIWNVSAGHSRRLISGGKAETDVAHNF